MADKFNIKITSQVFNFLKTIGPDSSKDKMVCTLLVVKRQGEYCEIQYYKDGKPTKAEPLTGYMKSSKTIAIMEVRYEDKPESECHRIFYTKRLDGKTLIMLSGKNKNKAGNTRSTLELNNLIDKWVEDAEELAMSIKDEDLMTLDQAINKIYPIGHKDLIEEMYETLGINILSKEEFNIKYPKTKRPKHLS